MKPQVIAEMLSTSTEVAYSAFMAHTVGYDPRPAIGSVHVPAAYVRSMSFMSDLNRLQDAWPRLMIAQTLGSGHFAMLEVPEQINAMIERFVAPLKAQRARWRDNQTLERGRLLKKLLTFGRVHLVA